jgi:hypothetical protein
MKRITLTLCSILLLTTVKNLQAQDAEEMKPYQDFMTPGTDAQMDGKFNGNWEADMTGYMDPTKPEKSKATNVTRRS